MRNIICPGCDREKPHSAKGLCKKCYDRQRYEKNRDKILAQCRHYQEMNKEKVAAYGRRYRKINRDRIKARVKRWAQENPGKRAATSSRWRRNNPDKAKATQRRWAQNNPEAVKAKDRRWRQRNPDRVVMYSARRRARKRAQPDTLTPEQLDNLLEIGQATYGSLELHLDHFISLNKGGGTTRANVHYIPIKLNCSKGDRLPKDVYEQLYLREVCD